MKGTLIEFEGTDSSGKATQSKLLFEKLKHYKLPVELYSLPSYDSFFGSLVGKYLSGDFGSKEELPAEFPSLLYTLERYQLKKEIENKLKSGKVLVFDRYFYSNIAHQSAKFLKRNEQDEFITWIKLVESRLPRPTKKIFLDMPIDVGQKLMHGRDRKQDYRKGQEKDQHEKDVAYLERVRDVYKRVIQAEGDWVTVNCVKPSPQGFQVKSRDEIHKEIWHKLRKYFGITETLGQN